MKSFLLILSVLSASAAQSDDLKIAKEALRDGLWSVARSHAGRLQDKEAKLIVLESFAREGKWSEIVKSLEKWEGVSSEEFLYWKALALFSTGKIDESASIIDAAKFSSPQYLRLAILLHAEIAALKGDLKKAREIVSSIKTEDCDWQMKMRIASVFEKSGENAKAQKLWNEVVSDKAADDEAVSVAVIKLGDEKLLRSAYSSVKTARLHRQICLKLGMVLISDPAKFSEGTNFITHIVKDAPDTPGAMNAYATVGGMILEKKDYQNAAKIFEKVFSTWPDAVSVGSFHESYAWALRNLGKLSEACDAFARASEYACDDERRATALLSQGDTLTDAGRGEEAMAKFREVLGKYPTTSAGKKLSRLVSLRELEQKGRELFAEFKFVEAQAVFAELKKKAPELSDRAEYYDMLCLYGLNKDALAIEKANRISEESKDALIRAEALLWRAKYFYNAGKWKEAGDSFQKYYEMKIARDGGASAMLWAARSALADGHYDLAVKRSAILTEHFRDSSEYPFALIVQGEALMNLARFDEAVLVLDMAMASKKLPQTERIRAETKKADSLFSLGADDQRRYEEALEIYKKLLIDSSLSPDAKLLVSYKIARTLEKLRRIDEALDGYYSGVVIAYRDNRENGVYYSDESRAAFVRAAFALADEYENRGKDAQAVNILRLVAMSDVAAAEEARKRINRIEMKGRFL
jgi:tetratricopeptide (TPR) repeat protein